jgi:ABC-type spermidine/putrescine transport system permease subunit II
MRRRSELILRGWLAVIVALLATPLVALVMLSFNASRYGTLPFEFSTRWYRALPEDSTLLEGLTISLSLAAQVTLISVVLGVALAMGLVRSVPAIRVPTNTLLLILLTVPAITLAAGMLEVLHGIGLGQSALSLVAACSVTSMPFVVLIVAGRLQAIDPSLAEAARSLGAGRSRVLFRITLPLIAPGVVAGALLAFVTCFNNFAIQLFIAPLGISTLPVQIYSMARLGITPTVSALGSLIVLSAVVVIIALNILTGSAARILTASKEESH